MVGRRKSDAATNGALPFKIVRNSRKTLVEQVSEGLRTSIISGRYAPGDVLPTIRDLAAGLGVSDIVTRAAIRTLAQENLVHPRPKIGIQVLGRGGKTWRGRILLVMRSDGRTYYVNVFTAALREKLVKAGYELVLVTVRPGNRPDLSELELQLAHPTNLSVVMFENLAAERALVRAKVPFVSIGNAGEPTLADAGRIEICRSAAAEPFAAACRAEGVRRVLEVGCERLSDVGPALRKAGVAVTRMTVALPHGGLMPEAAVRAARDAFLHLLGDVAWRKTDLVYFSDDHLCRGALIAFLQTGVRIPEDIRLATWANRGNVPVYAKDLSRLEIDPVADAAKVADACVATLSGGKPVKGVRLDTVFEHGETI